MGDAVVYADILFLIDFSMDFLTFFIVSKILKKKIKLIRMCSASAMGGVYSVVSLGMGFGSHLSLFFDIFVCFVMCMTAFLEKSSRQMKKMPLYTLLFFIVSAMLGGVMTSFFYLLNHSLSDIEGGRDELSLWVFGFVAILSGLTTLLGSNLLGKTSRARFGRLTVRLGQRSMTFEAMSDSGNMLRDPIGGKDVVIIDREKAKILVPALAGGRISTLPPSLSSRIRLIPIRTASGEGMLTGFSPDGAELDFGGEKKEIDVIVALSAESLRGSGCEAIVASDYFT